MYHVYMRNVLLRDEVYELLKSMKTEEESFADAIEKLYKESKAKKAVDYLEWFIQNKPSKDEVESAHWIEKEIGKAP